MNNTHNQAQAIGLDWGSTRVRSFLIGQDGACLDRRSSQQGVGQRTQSWSTAIEDLIGGWDSSLPIYAVGMIGSNKGLCSMSYVPTQCSLEEWLEGVKKGEHDAQCVNEIGSELAQRFTFTSGVSHQSSWMKDVMRGEEVMVFGYLHSLIRKKGHPARHLLCLPGTHSKWIETQELTLSRFQTMPTGELFALIQKAPLLGQGCRLSSTLAFSVEEHQETFLQGVKLSQDASDLNGHLFALRSRFLFDPADEPHQKRHQAFLSGLLIGHELKNPMIRDALIPSSVSSESAGQISLLATPPLSDLYCLALKLLYPSVPLQMIDADEVSVKGIWAIHQALSSSKV